MSDAGVLGFLDPQQPINYDFLDKQMWIFIGLLLIYIIILFTVIG